MFEVEGFRITRPAVPPLERLVVAIELAVTTTNSADFTAFTVAGRSYPLEQMYSDHRPRGYVLHAEQDRYTPTAAMCRAAALYHEHQADCVVIEANNGGDYRPVLLTEIDPTVQWRVVHATRNKRARAAPVAMLYEQAPSSAIRGRRTPSRSGGADDDVRPCFRGRGEVPGPTRLLRLGAHGVVP